jgi:uncharacterized protein (DUF1330 family)
MPIILPTQEQIEELNTISNDGPLVMVNMLRFKPDGGEAFYETYSQLTLPILNKVGAQVIYYGTDTKTFIGDDTWDVVLLVQYPSRSSFFKMITRPEYMEASQYRTQALADSRLYITRPQYVGWDNP